MDRKTGLYFPIRGFDPMGFKVGSNRKRHALSLASTTKDAQAKTKELRDEQGDADHTRSESDET